MTMVEKVARAIAEAEYGDGCTVDNIHMKQAHAAIEAMREPTAAMKAAAANVTGSHDIAHYAYRNAIDAALSETGER